MTKSQLNAIYYAYAKARRERQINFIREHDGTLQYFYQSKYKSMYWYILNKYNERIY